MLASSDQIEAPTKLPMDSRHVGAMGFFEPFVKFPVEPVEEEKYWMAAKIRAQYLGKQAEW